MDKNEGRAEVEELLQWHNLFAAWASEEEAVERRQMDGVSVGRNGGLHAQALSLWDFLLNTQNKKSRSDSCHSSVNEDRNWQYLMTHLSWFKAFPYHKTAVKMKLSLGFFQKHSFRLSQDFFLMQSVGSSTVHAPPLHSVCLCTIQARKVQSEVWICAAL